MSKSTKIDAQAQIHEPTCPDWCAGHRQPLAQVGDEDRGHHSPAPRIILTTGDPGYVGKKAFPSSVDVYLTQHDRERAPRVAITFDEKPEYFLTLDEAALLVGQLMGLLVRIDGDEARRRVELATAGELLSRKRLRRLRKDAERLLTEEQACEVFKVGMSAGRGKRRD